MDKTTVAKFSMHDDVVLLAGRLLLAWIFVPSEPPLQPLLATQQPVTS